MRAGAIVRAHDRRPGGARGSRGLPARGSRLRLRAAAAGARASPQRPRVRPRRRRRPLGARVPPRPGRPHGVPPRGRRRLLLRPPQPAASARRLRREVRRRVPRLPPAGLARGARPGPGDADRRAHGALVAAGHRSAASAPAPRRPRRGRVRAPLRPDEADRPRDRDRPAARLPRRAARPGSGATSPTPPPRATHAGSPRRCRSSRPRRRRPASERASARSRCCTRAGCTPARSAR